MTRLFAPGLRMLAVLMLCSIGIEARAGLLTIDFEIPGGSGPKDQWDVPNGHYGGLYWENVDILSTETHDLKGIYGVVNQAPGSHVGFNQQGNLAATLSNPNVDPPITFDFLSGYFAAVYTPGLTLTLTGTRDGAVVATDTVTFDTVGVSLFIEFDGFTDIDRLEFVTTTPNNQGHKHVVFDNLQFSVATVPEPSAVALFLSAMAGLGLITGVRRFRNSQAA